MNLFAHYYFSSNYKNHWYNAGLIFPDLFRFFTTGQHLSKIEQARFDNKNFAELKSGINTHIADDRIFHNWTWFKYKNDDILKKLRASKLDFKRDWVLSHIFIEMAIDCFLSSEFVENIDQLYLDLEKCNSAEWEIIFENCGVKDYIGWEKGFNNFLKNKYIYKYKDTSGIIYALNRIYESTGIGKFDEKQNDYLLILLIDIIPELKLKISELRKILK